MSLTFEAFVATRKWNDNLVPLLKEMGTIVEEDEVQPIAGYTYMNDKLWIEDATTFATTAPGSGQGRWCVVLGNQQPQTDDLNEAERLLYEEALKLGYGI